MSMGKQLPQIVAENMRRLRKERKLTQEELAHRSGLSGTYISCLERQQQTISLKTLERVAEALGVPVAECLRPQEQQMEKDPLAKKIAALFDQLDKNDAFLLYRVLRLISTRLR